MVTGFFKEKNVNYSENQGFPQGKIAEPLANKGFIPKFDIIKIHNTTY